MTSQRCQRQKRKTSHRGRGKSIKPHQSILTDNCSTPGVLQVGARTTAQRGREMMVGCRVHEIKRSELKLVAQRDNLCLFYSLVNSMADRSDVQRVLCGGVLELSNKAAADLWLTRASCHAIHSSRDPSRRNGYVSGDVEQFLRYLQGEKLIGGWTFREALQRDIRGVEMALFVAQACSALRNKRFILFGTTASKRYIEEEHLKVLKGKLLKKKKPDRNREIWQRADDVEKMKLFHARLSKDKLFDRWYRLSASSDVVEYPFSSHGIAVIFDSEGRGMIGDPGKKVFKELNFENFVESAVWVYKAFEFDVVLPLIDKYC